MKKGGPCNEEKHDKQASEDRNKASYVRPRGDGEIGGADAPRAKKEKRTDYPPQCRKAEIEIQLRVKFEKNRSNRCYMHCGRSDFIMRVDLLLWVNSVLE